VRASTPARSEPWATGIDGVSLGGFAALTIGLAYPTEFGAVSGLQPALQSEPVSPWVEKALAARARNPRLALRLLTSDGDYFRGVVGRVSQALRDAGVEHVHEVVRGPHDYVWNRGPGAYELLLWNDEALRG
jgi:enterochelin esterase-like enzyme